MFPGPQSKLRSTRPVPDSAVMAAMAPKCTTTNAQLVSAVGLRCHSTVRVSSRRWRNSTASAVEKTPVSSDSAGTKSETTHFAVSRARTAASPILTTSGGAPAPSSDLDSSDDADTRATGIPHEAMNSTSPSLAPATFFAASARSFPTSVSSSDIAAGVAAAPDLATTSRARRSGGTGTGRNSMSSTGLSRMGLGSISTSAASMVASEGPAVRPMPTRRVIRSREAVSIASEWVGAKNEPHSEFGCSAARFGSQQKFSQHPRKPRRVRDA